ncbi:hypothetical protein C2I36_05775 [Rhodobacteraceae bacterium WD3A24]|nr:hypothetical protein C2I36_05775 [Rhodobacteraceae bacterium WD3A24]
MKKHLLSLAAALLAATLALPAAAECYADYRASRRGGSGLELQYGVIELPDSACASTSAASSQIRQRISSDGWELLDVMSIFGSDGLSSRRGRAGDYFLRY